MVKSDLGSQYDAVPFSLNEYDAIKQLYKSAFNIDLTYDFFIKTFDTSKLGEDVVGFIAKHKTNNTPAAYYGVFPVKLAINGKVVLAAQSGATMTNEEHRKRGLFVWLAKMTFERCKEQGIVLIYGQPNPYSFHGLVNSLGFKIQDYINVYDLKLRVKTIPIAKTFLRLDLFHFYIKVTRLILSKRIINNVEEFHNNYPSDLGKVYRDRSYIIYKSQSHKLFLRVNKSIVWMNFSDVLWIGDFNDYNLIDEKTVKKLKRLARLLGYNTIRFNFNESLPKPEFLQHFKKTTQEASCFFYLTKELEDTNLVLTAADFDTW